MNWDGAFSNGASLSARSRLPREDDFAVSQYTSSVSIPAGPLKTNQGSEKMDKPSISVDTSFSRHSNDSCDEDSDDKPLLLDSSNSDSKPWALEEDFKLLQLQAAVGNKWSWIAQKLPGRSESQVKTRFKSILRAKQRMWTEEEDELLIKLRNKSTDWDEIVKRFPKRTKNGLRVRHRQLQYKKKGAIEKLNPGSPRQALLNGYNQDITEKKNWEKSNAELFQKNLERRIKRHKRGEVDSSSDSESEITTKNSQKNANEGSDEHDSKTTSTTSEISSRITGSTTISSEPANSTLTQPHISIASQTPSIIFHPNLYQQAFLQQPLSTNLTFPRNEIVFAQTPVYVAPIKYPAPLTATFQQPFSLQQFNPASFPVIQHQQAFSSQKYNNPMDKRSPSQ